MSMDWSEDELRLRLHPLTLGGLLIRASILITAYELLKDAVVEPVRDFLADHWTQNGPADSREYQSTVLTHGGRVRGSLSWLIERRVITPDQATAFERLRSERNRVTHEMAAMLVDPTLQVDSALIGEAVGLAQSLDRFWGVVAVETSAVPEDREIDYDGIRSGTSLLLEHLEHLSVLAGALMQAASEPESQSATAGRPLNRDFTGQPE